MLLQFQSEPNLCVKHFSCFKLELQFFKYERDMPFVITTT